MGSPGASVLELPVPGCRACRGDLRLVGLEPHETKGRTDVLTFQCDRCGAIDTREVIRRSAAGPRTR